MHSDWEWFGNAGHFICAQWCQFHLCTKVGPWLVSTVGQYVPESEVREIHCKVRNIELVGRGDERLADYMRKVGFQEIGWGRTYETMVFKAGKPCEVEGCNCGMPKISGLELDMESYNDPRSATIGHLNMCKKYAEVEDEEES